LRNTALGLLLLIIVQANRGVADLGYGFLQFVRRPDRPRIKGSDIRSGCLQRHYCGTSNVMIA
jgi:hypothetical protein